MKSTSTLLTATVVVMGFALTALAGEDRRFRAHHGVDWQAMLRAVLLLVRHDRVVSGGSTITMQLARLLDPSIQRTVGGKLRQGVLALKLEQHRSPTVRRSAASGAARRSSPPTRRGCRTPAQPA